MSDDYQHMAHRYVETKQGAPLAKGVSQGDGGRYELGLFEDLSAFFADHEARRVYSVPNVLVLALGFASAGDLPSIQALGALMKQLADEAEDVTWH